MILPLTPLTADAQAEQRSGSVHPWVRTTELHSLDQGIMETAFTEHQKGARARMRSKWAAFKQHAAAAAGASAGASSSVKTPPASPNRYLEVSPVKPGTGEHIHHRRATHACWRRVIVDAHAALCACLTRQMRLLARWASLA